MKTKLLVVGLLLSSSVAFAGRGGSTTFIKAAIASGSADAIVAEIERAEALACLSCIEPVRQLVDHPSQRVRDVAGWWLGRRGVRDEVIADMKARLTGQDPTAARNAADVLAAMRDYNTLGSLTAYLQHPLDEDSGVAAAQAIGAIGHPSSLPALKLGLGSSMAGVRAASAEAIRSLRAPLGQKAPSDAAALLPLFSDADANVRRQAALTSGYVRDAQAVAGLSQLLASDAVPLVRKAAAWALGEIGDGNGVAALTAAANDADPMVRSVANAALGRLK
jgi:HEAT repeat protein